MWLMVHRNIVKPKITDDMRTIVILLTYLAMLPFTACFNSESDLNAEQQELETEPAEIEKEQEKLLEEQEELRKEYAEMKREYQQEKSRISAHTKTPQGSADKEIETA